MRALFAHVTRVSLVLVGVSIASTAHAEKKKLPAPEPPPKAQKLDFDDDVVDGTLWAPEGSVVDRTRPVKHETLIRVRTSFVAELCKSAEDR